MGPGFVVIAGYDPCVGYIDQIRTTVAITGPVEQDLLDEAREVITRGSG